MKEKILIVDDDPNILEAYQRKLQKVLHVDTALGGIEGLRKINERGPYAVVISDLQMPGINGIDFLAKVKEIAPDTVRMMLTGNADLDTAMAAVNEGSIYRFLTKPCPADVFGRSLLAGIEQYRLVITERQLLEETLNGSVELLVEILSWANPEAFGESLRLRGAVKSIAREMGIREAWDLELATTLSQIGCIAVPHDLLKKSREGAPLTGEELDIIERAPQFGYELVARIPRLQDVAKIILYHKKHYDGTGFPQDGVSGNDLPVGARILKILFDLGELESTGLTRKAVLSELQARVGWYDPRILDSAIAFFTIPEASHDIEVTDARERTMSTLQIGDVLVSGVKTLDHRLLVGPGQTITQAVLVRLKIYSELAGLEEPIQVRRP